MKAASRFAKLLAITTVVALATTGVAFAAKISTSVEGFNAEQVSPGTVKYSGKIRTSGKPATKRERCLKGRAFRVIHNGVIIATGVTDKDGNFSVEGPEPPSGDQVQVRFKSTRKCKGASDAIDYEAPSAP